MVEASAVMVHLRRCGVIVHHAARMPTPASGQRSVVVFLETTNQCEAARLCALRFPGVWRVTFAGFSRKIMYVYGAAELLSRARNPAR
jgi:hypothetical protein